MKFNIYLNHFKVTQDHFYRRFKYFHISQIYLLNFNFHLPIFKFILKQLQACFCFLQALYHIYYTCYLMSL